MNKLSTIPKQSTTRPVRFPGLAGLLADRGLTQAEIAARAGCSPGHLRAVNHWRRVCSDPFYRRLRAALGCSAGELQPQLGRALVPAAGSGAALPQKGGSSRQDAEPRYPDR